VRNARSTLSRPSGRPGLEWTIWIPSSGSGSRAPRALGRTRTVTCRRRRWPSSRCGSRSCPQQPGGISTSCLTAHAAPTSARVWSSGKHNGIARRSAITGPCNASAVCSSCGTPPRSRPARDNPIFCYLSKLSTPPSLQRDGRPGSGSARHRPGVLVLITNRQPRPAPTAAARARGVLNQQRLPHAHTDRLRRIPTGGPAQPHDSDHDAVAATALARDMSKTSSNGGAAPSSHHPKVSARGPQHNRITHHPVVPTAPAVPPPGLPA
jgi:hypothetical protein